MTDLILYTTENGRSKIKLWAQEQTELKALENTLKRAGEVMSKLTSLHAHTLIQRFATRRVAN